MYTKTSSLKLKWVPPIVLTCLLPKAYPSHLSPIFTIFVQWLDATNISSLCKELDTIWMGQIGQEVVYSWVDFLQRSSLSYLDIDKRISFPASQKADDAQDRRAISKSEVGISSILSYNETICNEKFYESLHKCGICLSEYAGTKFVRLPCLHLFCHNCMEMYSQMRAKEREPVLCPERKCKEPVPHAVVKSMLGVEKFEQLESQLLQKMLYSMSNSVYCPRCEQICSEEDHFALCPNCYLAFCVLCRDKYHPGTPCLTLEEKIKQAEESLKILKNSNLLLPVQKKHLPPLMSNQQHKELEIMRSEEEIMRTTKRCPACHISISRTEGCNHIHCLRCGQDFCYNCGMAYEKGKFRCNECSLRHKR
ncbi:hypothetical protein MKW94_027461 [Papaver nudicaule]|uniref:RBR-type E3 ubiquitin transferase n=1 Tax=Papaver nudicaule TaxID=74823 RepID=A0AA42AX06_PAPNU|nr:hypothetical protein [Papaver nudicaule]